VSRSEYNNYFQIFLYLHCRKGNKFHQTKAEMMGCMLQIIYGQVGIAISLCLLENKNSPYFDFLG